jgi:hypothetical protein
VRGLQRLQACPPVEAIYHEAGLLAGVTEFSGFTAEFFAGLAAGRALAVPPRPDPAGCHGPWQPRQPDATHSCRCLRSSSSIGSNTNVLRAIRSVSVKVRDSGDEVVRSDQPDRREQRGTAARR